MAEINPSVTYGKKRGAMPGHKHNNNKVPIIIQSEGLGALMNESQEDVPPLPTPNPEILNAAFKQGRTEALARRLSTKGPGALGGGAPPPGVLHGGVAMPGLSPMPGLRKLEGSSPASTPLASARNSSVSPNSPSSPAFQISPLSHQSSSSDNDDHFSSYTPSSRPQSFIFLSSDDAQKKQRSRAASMGINQQSGMHVGNSTQSPSTTPPPNGGHYRGEDGLEEGRRSSKQPALTASGKKLPAGAVPMLATATGAPAPVVPPRMSKTESANSITTMDSGRPLHSDPSVITNFDKPATYNFIDELISSENKYTASLQGVMDVYVRPLMGAGGKIAKEDSVRTMFIHLGHLHAFHLEFQAAVKEIITTSSTRDVDDLLAKTFVLKVSSGLTKSKS